MANNTKTETMKQKKKTIPVKTSLNLYTKERSSLRPSQWIPGVILIVLLAVLFGKFAVVDRYHALAEAEAKLASERAELDALRAGYADYNEVQKEYGRYTYTGFDRTIADRLDLLDLLEREVFPVAEVRQLSISDKTMSMTLVGLSLDQISDLMNRLEADPLVKHVTVSTTGYGSTDRDKSETPRANMTVELADAVEAKGGEQ